MSFCMLLMCFGDCATKHQLPFRDFTAFGIGTVPWRNVKTKNSWWFWCSNQPTWDNRCWSLQVTPTPLNWETQNYWVHCTCQILAKVDVSFLGWETEMQITNCLLVFNHSDYVAASGQNIVSQTALWLGVLIDSSLLPNSNLWNTQPVFSVVENCESYRDSLMFFLCVLLVCELFVFVF